MCTECECEYLVDEEVAPMKRARINSGQIEEVSKQEEQLGGAGATGIRTHWAALRIISAQNCTRLFSSTQLLPVSSSCATHDLSPRCATQVLPAFGSVAMRSTRGGWGRGRFVEVGRIALSVFISIAAVNTRGVRSSGRGGRTRRSEARQAVAQIGCGTNQFQVAQGTRYDERVLVAFDCLIPTPWLALELIPIGVYQERVLERKGATRFH